MDQQDGGAGGVENGRLSKLMEEKERLDESFPEAVRLLEKEIENERCGLDKTKFIEVHNPTQSKADFRVRLPVKEFPQANFVGKLVGPGGKTISGLSEQTGCRLAIFGRGSIRDKNKEDELRKQGGKYAHLNAEQHLFIEASGTPLAHCYQKIAHAISIIQPLIMESIEEYHMGGGGGGGRMGRGGGMQAGGRGGRGGGMMGGMNGGGMRGGRGGMMRGGARGGAGMRGGMRGGASRGSAGGFGRGGGRGGMGGGRGGMGADSMGGGARGGRGGMGRGGGGGRGNMASGRGGAGMGGAAGWGAGAARQHGGAEGYGAGAYDYESAAGGGYENAYDSGAGGDVGYGDTSGYAAAPEANEGYGYEYSGGQAGGAADASYDAGYGGWAAEGGTDAFVGKAPPAGRGGGFRSRPY